MATDESLVLLLRNRKHTSRDRDDAARQLTSAYKSVLCGSVVNQVENVGQFLAATGAISVEAFCADVLGKACKTWSRRGGASFSTWLHLLLTRAIIDGRRAFKKLPKPLADRDGEDLSGGLEDPSKNASPLDQLAMLDALDLARACLEGLPERSRQVFVWTVFLGMSYDQIRDIWPHESVDNLKQIKHRATLEYVARWERKGGADLEDAVQNVAGAVADRVDPARIRNPKAREAYLAWVALRNLAAAAKKLKMKDGRLRSLLHEAMKDLFDQGMYRGGMPVRDAGLEAALAQRAERILEFARAAFGFSKPEQVIHTLGSLIHSRLSKVEDYDAACRELGLKPAALRKLLSDELDLEKDFFDRLSRYLDVPAAQLRALPRRPAGGTRLRLRSKSGFDADAFQERVLAWVRK